MNHKGIVKLTPNNFGRMLALHGRSSTAGAFPLLNEFDASECMKQLNKAQDGKPPNERGARKHMEASAVDADDETDEKEIDGQMMEKGDVIPTEVKANMKKAMPPEEKAVNPPLSKIIDKGKNETTPSYSFYKRNFKVKGNKAWEYAMRDLGSVDTLLNRYGFVEPRHREGPTAALSDDINMLQEMKKIQELKPVQNKK